MRQRFNLRFDRHWRFHLNRRRSRWRMDHSRRRMNNRSGLGYGRRRNMGDRRRLDMRNITGGRRLACDVRRCGRKGRRFGHSGCGGRMLRNHWGKVLLKVLRSDLVQRA